eukprot:CAMPEP_0171886226 /NCGR_PEP_ID=MMETSP0992-20121227/41773_1 /TAXON_ID=483369 /ORGANISM="non described non described, Strain CCMP2098" /LENGTH=44 /DNA_ID= /DNA_START= /DNA_END= /DNA_ORIENTATION=
MKTKEVQRLLSAASARSIAAAAAAVLADWWRFVSKDDGSSSCST